MMDNTRYLQSVTYVLAHTDATRRQLLRRVKLPGGIPFRFVAPPVAGPQCVSVTVQIRDEDLRMVESLGDRFAMAAGSRFARVYRDLAVVRIEFTLPRSQWREVHLGQLLHRANSATIGQKALGPVARLDWAAPHKAIFGATRSGKTVLLADLIISLARTHSPAEYQFLIINPKNDPALGPFTRLAHLAAPVAVDYASSAALLRFALAEMERRRAAGGPAGRPRLVVVVDEVAQLVQVAPEAGPLITQLVQMAAGLNINLVVASQAANPTVFGRSGSLAKANFSSRIVFHLPREQAYLATGIEGQQTDKLGGDGDGLAVANDRVTRIRAALPEEGDYAALPRLETEPAPIPADQVAGDVTITDREYLNRLAYALVFRPAREPVASGNAIRKQFRIKADTASKIRDDASFLRGRVRHWQRAKRQEGVG